MFIILFYTSLDRRLTCGPKKDCILASSGTEENGSLNSQLVPLMGPKHKKPTSAEGCLPWRRDRNGTLRNLIVALY